MTNRTMPKLLVLIIAALFALLGCSQNQAVKKELPVQTPVTERPIASSKLSWLKEREAMEKEPGQSTGDREKVITSGDAISKATESQKQSLVVRDGFALVVGISTYQHAGKSNLTNLIYADEDARAFAKILTRLGWSENRIKLLTNKEATQRNVMLAIESWLTKAKQDDVIVFFWSGHGYPDPEDPEKVYFACYDTDLSLPATGYRMDHIRRSLEEKKAKNVIILADTCHAGKLITRGEKGISIVPQIEKMSRDQNVPKGWIFMVGADSDRLAIEHSSWSNGAFTHSLIRGLEGAADGFMSSGSKDGFITLGELRTYMMSVMPEETQKVLGVAKHPVITTSSGDPHIWEIRLDRR